MRLVTLSIAIQREEEDALCFPPLLLSGGTGWACINDTIHRYAPANWIITGSRNQREAIIWAYDDLLRREPE